MATALCVDKDASDELWKECAQWLTRWGMLREDHRANWVNAGISDLAHILRDGVLLCKLLNKIDPGCIDMKDVNLKPTMAQFLSLRNIELFLRTCKISFGLRDNELFEPLMLFELTNFHKVLCTLSKLSQSQRALQEGILGFTAQRVKNKEEEVIYQSLKSVKMPAEERVTADYNEMNEEIYQDLCEVRRTTELQPTFEKRDFVIRELLDTEKNYVEVLSKLKKIYMKPLNKYMTSVSLDGYDTIFYKISELHDIHLAFYTDLKRFKDPGHKLSQTFMKFREKFLVYGNYCANLSKATNLLQELCDNNEDFHKTIIKYEKEDNNGRFKLRDVLSVPMQRILKYHLLLDKLIENTDPNHDEYNDLRRAREAMLDVAAYINEAARDSEHLAVIRTVQENIVEWTLAPHHQLTDYGRLIKDGELRIKAHDDQKTRNRYVFIFDKCILICKQLKGQQFAFRDLINIVEYHVEENHNRPVLNRDARFSYSFFLVKNDSQNVYTTFVRTIELKEQMIKAINDALDNINPQSIKRTRSTHAFEMETFDAPIQCFHCSKYLRGLIYQGYRCTVCHIKVHKSCIGQSGRCGAPPPPTLPMYEPPMNGADAALKDKLWFVGEMDRGVAQGELEGREDGTFLVRIRPLCDDKDKYALTLKWNGAVKHMKICSTDAGEDKKFFLSLSKFFCSIEELVLNYQDFSLKENFERLEEDTKLLWPYRQVQAVGLRDFEPADALHLRMPEGATVTVLERDGYRDGWWKGRNPETLETGYFPCNFVRVDGEANSF